MHRHFVAARLLQAIPTLAGAAIAVFVLVRVVPGNPIAMMLAPGATAADVERLRALYGLDGGWALQFWRWLVQALQGDLGTSISLRQSVLALVLSRLPATLELAFLALMLAVGAGLPPALLGAARPDGPVEAAIDAVTGLLFAIPDFLWALALTLAFGVLLPLAPISGRISPGADLAYVSGFYLVESLLRLDFRSTADLLRHMLLPALALCLPLAAMICRTLKASLKECLGQDYILLARAKGFSRPRIVIGEALRNAAIPTLALTGVQFTFLVGGTVLIEKIFAFPGIGNLAIDAVINRDLPLIQGLILTFAVLFIAVNLAVDLLHGALDPKLRGQA